MRLSFLIVLGGALVAACAEAGGEPSGGELTNAGREAVAPGEFAPPVVDAGLVTTCGEGATWSSLYRDIFGPTGQPGSCVLQATCHGSPDGAGAQASAGIKCYDETGCLASMIDRNLVQPGQKPERAVLWGIIRTRNPTTGKVGGIMPKSPSDYVYPDACVERIRQWIANGIPAN